MKGLITSVEAWNYLNPSFNLELIEEDVLVLSSSSGVIVFTSDERNWSPFKGFKIMEELKELPFKTRHRLELASEKDSKEYTEYLKLKDKFGGC